MKKKIETVNDLVEVIASAYQKIFVASINSKFCFRFKTEMCRKWLQLSGTSTRTIFYTASAKIMLEILFFNKFDVPVDITKILFVVKYTLFFIRTSNFGVEAERSYFFFSI